MALSNPQVQLVCQVDDEDNETYFLHIVSHFDTSDYFADGYDNLPEVVDSVLTVTVRIGQSGEPLRLIKQVVHLVPLVGVDLESVATFAISVKQENTELALKSVPHQSESTTILRPIPEVWIGSND